jgi:transcriptional regulator with PAS, ATPase and Fis domain
MGPCTSSNHSCLHSISLVADYAHKRIHAVDQAQHKAVLEEFSDMQLMAVISPNDRREPMPPREKVLQVLKILGRDEQENHGCQACGYHSCNAFAIDVAKGIMKPEMCVSYNLRNRQEYIKQLTDSNRKLADTQKALERSQRKMLSEHEAAKETTKMVDDVMQKLPSGIVIVDKDLRILQSNLKFIELIGDEAHEIAEVIPGLFNADLRSLMPQQVYTLFEYVLKENEPITNRDLNYSDKLLNLTVFPIQKGKIVGAVFRDLFEPEVRRDEVVLRITDVIDKNLQMVQQIGFLLGEGASETEKMLNSIIESFRKDTSK